VPRPSAVAVSNRALALYALVRRGAIEYALGEFGPDPQRFAQAERARVETDRWLERESVASALTEAERRLFESASGAWPPEAVADAMWRKESLGVLLWALQHLADLPPYGEEADQQDLDHAITRYGAVSAFRAEGALRAGNEIEQAWLEADAWFGATEGEEGEDATVASIAAERFRALSWLRDDGAVPP